MFYHLTYEGAVDPSAVSSPVELRALETQINEVCTPHTRHATRVCACRGGSNPVADRPHGRSRHLHPPPALRPACLPTSIGGLLSSSLQPPLAPQRSSPGMPHIPHMSHVTCHMLSPSPSSPLLPPFCLPTAPQFGQTPKQLFTAPHPPRLARPPPPDPASVFAGLEPSTPTTSAAAAARPGAGGGGTGYGEGEGGSRDLALSLLATIIAAAAAAPPPPGPAPSAAPASGLRADTSNQPAAASASAATAKAAAAAATSPGAPAPSAPSPSPPPPGQPPMSPGAAAPAAASGLAGGASAAAALLSSFLRVGRYQPAAGHAAPPSPGSGGGGSGGGGMRTAASEPMLSEASPSAVAGQARTASAGLDAVGAAGPPQGQGGGLAAGLGSLLGAAWPLGGRAAGASGAAAGGAAARDAVAAAQAARGAVAGWGGASGGAQGWGARCAARGGGGGWLRRVAAAPLGRAPLAAVAAGRGGALYAVGAGGVRVAALERDAAGGVRCEVRPHAPSAARPHLQCSCLLLPHLHAPFLATACRGVTRRAKGVWLASRPQVVRSAAPPGEPQCLALLPLPGWGLGSGSGGSAPSAPPDAAAAAEAAPSSRPSRHELLALCGCADRRVLAYAPDVGRVVGSWCAWEWGCTRFPGARWAAGGCGSAVGCAAVDGRMDTRVAQCGALLAGPPAA